MKNSKVTDCQIIDIRRYSDSRGYLSVVENRIDIPFDIKRIYYLYLVPEVARGAHAHKQFIPPGLWRDLENFSGGAVLMCLASEKYDAADYIRDYDEFLKYKY